MSKRHVTAIVFDLDGTLLASMDGLADCAVGVVSAQYGLSEDAARRAYLETSGIPFFQQLEVLFPGDPRNVLANERFTYCKKQAYLTWPLYPGVPSLLKFLREQGIRLAISSNSEHHLVKHVVKRKGIRVDCALGWQPGFVKGPDHFAYFEKIFAVRRQEMVFVGDSLWDAKLASESGVAFVAKLGTMGKAIFETYYPQLPTLEHITELQDWILEWNASSLLPAVVND